MMKAAAFAGAIVLGFASWANAQVQVVIGFANPQIGGENLASDTAQPDYNAPGTNAYQLDYTNVLWYPNTDDWYGTTGFRNFTYSSGFGTYSLAITPDPGMEVLLDQLVVGKGPGSTDAETINITTTGGTGGLAQAVNFAGDADQMLTFNYAGAGRPRNAAASGIVISWTEANPEDFGLDSFTFTFQAVPEPTVLAPMALAGMGMFLRRRRA